MTDPNVVRYVCDVSTKEQALVSLEIETRRGAGGRLGIWSITQKDTGEKIGTCVLLPLPIEKDDTDWDLLVDDAYPDAEIEVGYMFIPSAWGKGFATEACQRLVNFGFEMTSLQEIVATADEDNHASHNVLKKCGLSDDWRLPNRREVITKRA